MRSSPLRLALPLAAALAAFPLSQLNAADAEPAKIGPDTPAVPAAEAAPATTPADGTTAAATAAPAPAPAAVADQDTAEAKLAVVLRSYSLLQDENDQLKAAQEKLQAQNASLEAQLAVAKNAMPLASQAAGLREQLRQTQDQLAAAELENRDLKTRLATGQPVPGKLTPTNVPTTPPPVAAPPPAAPEPRIHVVVSGETLGKISRQYYGTSSRWPDILAANRDVLKSEKSLTVGMKLKIP